MKSIAFLLVFLFIISSCTDNTVEGQKDRISDGGGKISTISYTYDPSNLLNPFDSIGYWHNEAVNEVISNKNLFSCDSADLIDELKTILTDWFDDNQSYLPAYFSENYVDSLINLTVIRFSDFTPNSIIENYAYNDTAETEIEDLFDLILGYTDSTNLNPLINSIKSWESSIVSSNYSEELKEVLLKNSAIVRWSAAYWWDVANDTNDPWWTVINCNPGMIKNQSGEITGFWDVFVKVLGIGAADGLGYIGGGLVGAVTGSVLVGVHLFTDGGILGAIDDIIEWIGGLIE